MSGIDYVELRVVRVPLREPFGNSAHVATEKVAVLVTVGDDGVEGYGEGVMEPLPWFREETIGGALTVLGDALVPDLLRHGCADPLTLADRWSFVRGNPMAKAALEMAVWDLRARQAGRPMWEMLGGDGEPIEAGAALGLADDTTTLIDTVARHVGLGYRRIKVKVTPGREQPIVAAVRREFPDISLSIDANCAYTLADSETIAALDAYRLDYVEQPLHWDDLTDHSTLATRIDTPICLDESLTSPERVALATRLGACSVVNVKAGRLGGLAAVLRTAEICRDAGMPMWCGGMLELGIGRAHNIHLATVAGFDLPGDTASASRSFAHDIVNEPLEATDGLMPVPDGPGIGVTIDRQFVDSVTESVQRHTPG